jgi:hypothetical protein
MADPWKKYWPQSGAEAENLPQAYRNKLRLLCAPGNICALTYNNHADNGYRTEKRKTARKNSRRFEK